MRTNERTNDEELYGSSLFGARRSLARSPAQQRPYARAASARIRAQAKEKAVIIALLLPLLRKRGSSHSTQVPVAR